MRILHMLALACTLLTAASEAQPPAFAVATIKPAQPDPAKFMVGVRRTPDGIDAQFVTLAMLMQYAYGSQRFPSERQVVNLPDWANQRYNVQAKMTEAEAAALKNMSREDRDQQIGLMLQALLADRFNLKVHTDSKPGSTYSLTLAKGSRLPTPVVVRDEIGPTDTPMTKGSFIRMEPGGKTIVHEYSMAKLAAFFTQHAHELDRPVVDKTGLPGVYNLTLNWAPGGFTMSSQGDVTPTAPTDAPSLFTALQEVGLKLQPSTTLVETLVIDHVDRPTPN